VSPSPSVKNPGNDLFPAAATGAPTPSPAAVAPSIRDDRVRFGTSSFSSEDWVGPFYPPGTPPADFLRLYAREFDTVEVDATYYAIPSPRTVAGWVEKTPDGFLISAKFPRSIVHGGDAERPDPAKVLVLDEVAKERDQFIDVIRRLGPRLGPLVLQFPYFNRDAFPSAASFLDRLDRFFDGLPTDLAYGVEVRNKAWVGKPLRDLLARRGASLVLVDQAWMPHGDEIAAKMDPVTSDVVYVRLLGDRQAIEKLTKTWDREVIDHTDRLSRWADLLVTLAARGVKVLVYVNNHYAGHAPATVRRIRAMYEEKFAAKRRELLGPERAG
jgi:uncharacterized protein YecE (DUF72 family)